MKTIRIEPNFDSWRSKARELLSEAVRPETILWEDGTSTADSLFDDLDSNASQKTTPPKGLRIPREFMNLAELVACHRASDRWGVLYKVAWRLTHGKERQLLALHIDSDLKRLEVWASAVRRDRHKMKAFVRFRKVSTTESGCEQFVAWFEPEHSIVELTAPFFAKRFASMEWSILTPWRCAHWNGKALQFSPGVSSREAPKEDQLEDFWRSYYAHIFNPARLKLDAMQSEMPKKYWKNLPEAPLIVELTRKAAKRMGEMVEAPVSAKAHVSERIPSGVPNPEPQQTVIKPEDVLARADAIKLAELRQLGLQCRACPLYDRATQVVFGEGPEDAEIMIVGEQPGDSEDLAGRPFVGPSGDLLDKVLSGIGIDRQAVYVTNTVKHFKWKREGKRRLHQTPKADEVHACRPWVLAEILKVKPKTLICLGATAAKALVRPDFAILRERGRVPDSELAYQVIVTVHPSYLLRMPRGEERELELARWISDLTLALKAP
ncbi:UdgX family uracil-DNA binding protein [Verrucomicrobiales bacterium]|nr:UdgX family uracil-DNA binding protein [Verrucomicrobiales bacterium]MDB4526968.1 UdgX family uracil-DNA binding protein [bacterium]MDC0312826.1 UdgX family uracil-DNA binding protein [Verrucomicrobiales bacterium]MDF1788552.1 UdgX family uracil-DNA binding protein [Verrucomicrobiales bacterium]